MPRRCATMWTLVAGLAACWSAAPALAVFTITNGGFDAQDGSVHLNSTISPTGWFAGSNAANTQSDTMINAQNGAQGSWLGNAFLFGNSTPFANDGTSEQGYIYQSIGTYAGEASVTVRGYVYNRINPGNLVGNFDVGLYFSGPGGFTPAVGNDVAAPTAGSTFGVSSQVLAQGVDFTITTGTTPQRAAWSYTAAVAGSGISNGDTLWLRIGDGGNPTATAADEPVIDNINLAPFDIGDVNGDGLVDINTDFAAIRANFRKTTGVTRAMGDLDGSGDVDFLDYMQWRQKFLGVGGLASDIPALNGVPEPTGLALVVIGIAALATRARRKSALLAVLGMISLAAAASPALAIDNPWIGTTGAWTTTTNWTNGVVPTRAADQFPVIDNAGVAQITAALTDPNIGGLRIGTLAGNTGTLEISGGTLNATNAGAGVGNGIVTLGAAGTGTLRMTGGIFNTRDFNIGQNATNLVELSNNAKLAVVGNIGMGGTTRITGSAVAFTATNFSLRDTSVFAPVINSNSAWSTLKTTTPSGVATINGSINVTFSGVTPPVGSTWSLVEAGAVVGNFSNRNNVTVAGIPLPLASGEAYRTRVTNAGAFGRRLELIHDSVLVLEVNRDTGAATIRNPLGGAIQISSYSISSAAGSLVPATWSSLADQATSGWQEGALAATHLEEFNPNTGGNFNFTSVPSKPIGVPYDDGAAFFTRGIGGVGTDLLFDYLTLGTAANGPLPAGEVIRGQVVYTGTGKTNSLLVTINPATGAATLKNDSPGTITIDGFSILSTGAALTPGTFTGLGSGLLTTVSPTTSALSQLALTPNSPLAISGGQSFNIGNIFSVGQAQTGFSVEFTTQGSTNIYNGTVRFQAAGLLGDYNGDTKVDGADFLVWQRGGSPNGATPGDLQTWKDNYGQSLSVGAAAAVPEPTAVLLCLAACGAGAQLRRRGGRSA